MEVIGAMEGSDTPMTLGDRDLRRRLMALVGAPLTASAGSATELSDEESVAAGMFDSLVCDVYRTAREC